MNKFTIIAICLLASTAVGTVCAGPVLDEILNYMYLDQTTSVVRGDLFPAQRSISLTRETPIGQTFVTGPETERNIRIRTYIRPDADWQRGEGVELVLWDSADKKTSIGRYTVWYEYRGFQHGRVEFEVKARVQPSTTYYFELTYVGDGDGKLSPVGVMNGQDDYKAGAGYLGGKPDDFDVCFQTHAKRPMGRVGNLKKMFSRFDLNRPELVEVKMAVDRGDYEAGIAAIVRHLESRQKPVSIIDPKDVAAFDPDFDTTAGDLAMRNYFGEAGTGYAGPDINWRGEPEFNPDGTIAGSYWNTGMGRSGAIVALGPAYASTGNEKYARKLNDVLIDCYLDNPPPTASKIGGGGNDPVWATLDAGIRIGAFFWVYSKVHESPFFTLDARMGFILHLADCADVLVADGANDGGNWSFTQNMSMLQLSQDFPEYANSLTWRDAAIERIARTIKRDIYPDGVEMEAAPGYQRMSYGALAEVYRLVRDRGIETPFASELKGVIAKQAEYFMYLAQPNGETPFLGDWGQTDERAALLDDSKLLDRQDMLYVATAGKEGTKPKELSKLYPNAGMIIQRSDWGETGMPYQDARYLFLHGVTHSSHGHADLNEVTVYAHGRQLLADPGSYVYDSPEHALLCAAPVHNLVTLDGQNQNWRCDAKLKCWIHTPVADYVSSWAAAYSAGDTNREVLYVRADGAPGVGDYWIVRDIAEGRGTHLVEQRWHLVPGEAQLDSATLTARTSFDEGGNLAIMQVDPSRLQVEQTTTDTWWPRGVRSEPKKMPTMIYKTNSALPAAIDTVLFPFSGKSMPQVQLKTLEKSAGGLDSAFKLVQGNVDDLFAMRRSAGPKALPSEHISFDGDRLFVRRVGGKLRSAMLVNGQSLEVDGKQLIWSDKRLPWMAASFDASGVHIYTGSAEAKASVHSAKGLNAVVTDTGADALILQGGDGKQ